MAMLQLQAWLMVPVTIFCAIRAWRDFALGNITWGIVSLVVVVAAITAISIPMPTHAVEIDLTR